MSPRAAPPASPPREVRPRADSQTIYDELRTEIVSGVLPAGTPVREVPLATRFGISRTPVREALRRLQHDLLLVPGARGLQVRSIGPQEVVHVYDARILLEAEAARQAARSRGPADVVRLEGLLARDRALDDPASELMASTNMEFHAAVWAAAHNSILLDLLDRLTVHLIHAPRSTLSVPGRWAQALDEHAALVHAVADGDEDGAGQVAADHMRAAREVRLSLLRDAVASAGR